MPRRLLQKYLQCQLQEKRHSTYLLQKLKMLMRANYVHFYNVDDVKTERHSFTIGDPYKVDIDLGFGQNGNATFTADHSGLLTYYCRYHLPVMTGQLLVLP